MSFTPRIFAASHDSRSRIGISPVLSGVCSLVPEPPVVTRQNTTSRPSPAQRATLPAIVNSLSSGCAEMQRMRVNSDESLWALRLLSALILPRSYPRIPKVDGPGRLSGAVGLGHSRGGGRGGPGGAGVRCPPGREGRGQKEGPAELRKTILDLGHLRLPIGRRVEVG